MFTYTVKPV